MKTEILSQTDIYFTEKIEKFGATNWGVDWNSVESQEKRFEQISKVFSPKIGGGETICDYGCGYGAYYDYLKKNNYEYFLYTGIDISQKMIEVAEANHKAERGIVFINGSEMAATYDYIVASGIFNVRQNIKDNDWLNYILETMEMFNAHARKGYAFNCLTKYSDREYMKDYLYYCDPLYLFDYAKRNHSRNVAILHDYDLYEFTLIVRIT